MDKDVRYQIVPPSWDPHDPENKWDEQALEIDVSRHNDVLNVFDRKRMTYQQVSDELASGWRILSVNGDRKKASEVIEAMQVYACILGMMQENEHVFLTYQ